MPGRSYYDLLFCRHPQLRPGEARGYCERTSGCISSRSCGRFFAAYRLLCDDFNISRAVQVRNTDDSMMMIPCAKLRRGGLCRDRVRQRQPPAAVCDRRQERRARPLRGGGWGNGKTRRVPLDVCLDDDDEVQRREKPGCNNLLWHMYAVFAARHLQRKVPAEWKVLLVGGCKVHASAVGQKNPKWWSSCFFRPSATS